MYCLSHADQSMHLYFVFVDAKKRLHTNGIRGTVDKFEKKCDDIKGYHT